MVYLRWLLVLPVSILTFIVISVSLNYIIENYLLFGIGIRAIDLFLEEYLLITLSSYAFVRLGSETSPDYQFETAIVLTSLLILFFGSVIVYNVSIYHNFIDLLRIIFYAIGALWAVINVKNKINFF